MSLGWSYWESEKDMNSHPVLYSGGMFSKVLKRHLNSLQLSAYGLKNIYKKLLGFILTLSYFPLEVLIIIIMCGENHS